MTSDLDIRERHELADLLDSLGPDAPTLCEGWTTADMAAHLVVRERAPLAAPGILFGGPFARATERAMAKELATHGYAGAVERVRTGPPWGPTRIPPVRHAVNLVEMTVHHEDVRRANGGEPRTDRPDLDDAIWSATTRLARFVAMRARLGARLELRRPSGESVTVGRGDAHATLLGEPVELLLYLQGRRSAARVELTGDAAAVGAVESAHLGI